MDQVIRTYRDGHVCVVALEEREFKNTFTLRFVNGLKDAFASIGDDPEIRAVVVQGYDNYFCCGGTKEELIELYRGIGQGEAGAAKVQFTELNFHDLFLRCEVPVVAAMQGHCLGGGLALGCFADIIVMGSQCIYSANFMKYGFTPGMGATYIIPKKLGHALGTEMLLSARNYYGGELERRGAAVKVVEKQEVIKTALRMAEDLADKPRLSLQVLKRNLTRQIREDLPAAIERELEMHRITFAQPEVLERIETLFGN